MAPGYRTRHVTTTCTSGTADAAISTQPSTW
jgi:hypothetical protein